MGTPTCNSNFDGKLETRVSADHWFETEGMMVAMPCTKGLFSTRLAGSMLLCAAMAMVCSAQSPFFSDASQYAAKAETVSGQVSVLKDSQPWAVSLGDSIQVQQLILTGPDGYAVFRVSDGSTFEVYPNSRVTFRKNPGNWRDLLDLLVGRVRVHIQHFGTHRAISLLSSL